MAQLRNSLRADRLDDPARARALERLAVLRGDPLLGVVQVTRREQVVALEPGAALVLYSAGLQLLRLAVPRALAEPAPPRRRHQRAVPPA